MRPWAVAVAVVAMVAASCGGGDSLESSTDLATHAPTATTDAAAATNCEELADIDIAITQEFIDVFGDGPFEDWFTDSPAPRAGVDVWLEKVGKSVEQSASLGCDIGAEVENDYFCDGMPQLDRLGDAGLAFLHAMVPCDLDPADQARVNAFLNKGGPTATTTAP